MLFATSSTITLYDLALAVFRGLVFGTAIAIWCHVFIGWYERMRNRGITLTFVPVVLGALAIWLTFDQFRWTTLWNFWGYLIACIAVGLPIMIGQLGPTARKRQRLYLSRYAGIRRRDTQA